LGAAQRIKDLEDEVRSNKAAADILTEMINKGSVRMLEDGSVELLNEF